MQNPTAAPTQPATTEVLIVGGGPAGLAAAIALGQRGIDCTVVEARPPGIDKACGEGLMPDSRESLAQLGITLTDADGQLFHGIRFANATHHVNARFPSGTGIGVRRPHLHTLLMQRATETGAHLLWNSRVQLAAIEAAPNSGYHTAQINGQPIRYRWLIGADGQASTVRTWAGLDRMRRNLVRFGFRTHYRVDPASFQLENVEVHWARSGQLYITPVASDCVCVVYIMRDPATRSPATRSPGAARQRDPAAILASFPEVARRLAGAEAIPKPRGAVTATCKLHRVATSFVALLGDASGSADAITGEGLALCFRQGLALADSIATGSLTPYRRAHRRIGRTSYLMGSLMLMLDRWPALQVRAIRALAHTPGIFRELLHAHLGERALASVILRRGPRFGWNLLKQSTNGTRA